MIVPLGLVSWFGEVDEAKGEGGVANPVVAVGCHGAQSQGESAEGASDVIEAVGKGDFALGFDQADEFAWVILGEGQLRGQGTGAGAVT